MVITMGRSQGFITASKAAEILGCSVEKVHRLCDEGLVRRQMEGDTVYVRQEDVAELKRLRIAGEMKPGELIRRLLFLERTVLRLQDAVNLLYEVNNMSASRFHTMPDTELLQLYNNLLEDLGETTWEQKRILSYCEIFAKITEVEIDKLNTLLSVDHAWKPFYELCLKMSRYVVERKDFKTDLHLQYMRDLLYVGRKNLSTVAVLMIEKAAQLGPSRKLLEILAAANIDAFDALVKQEIAEQETYFPDIQQGRKKHKQRRQRR